MFLIKSDIEESGTYLFPSWNIKETPNNCHFFEFAHESVSNADLIWIGTFSPVLLECSKAGHLVGQPNAPKVAWVQFLIPQEQNPPSLKLY